MGRSEPESSRLYVEDVDVSRARGACIDGVLEFSQGPRHNELETNRRFRIGGSVLFGYHFEC